MIQKAIGLAVLGVLCFFLATATLDASEPNKIKDWIEQLRHPDVGIRIQAAAKLAEIGKLSALADSAFEALSACLQDPNGNVRLYASFALGRVGADTERSLIVLIPLLIDPDEHVRYSAEWSISEIAKSVSSREVSDEDARKLLGIFQSAESQLSRGAIQERHVMAVKLARAHLQSCVSKPKETQAAPRLPADPEPPVVNVSSLPPDNMQVSMTLYRTNDIAGRLLIVDQMASITEFDDLLRLAVLRHELRSMDLRVASYAVTCWQANGQRLLSQLFSELNESDLSEPYAEHIIQLLSPSGSTHLGNLCEIGLSPIRTIDIRIVSWNAVRRGVSNPNLDSATQTIAIPALEKIAFNTSEIAELRVLAIETLALFGDRRESNLSSLVSLFKQPQLPPEVRSAAAKALAKMAPGSRDLATLIVEFMRGLQVEDELFLDLADTLGQFGPTGEIGTELLVEGLHSKEVVTRMACAASLERIGHSAVQAIPALVDRIIDPTEVVAVKSQAAVALKQIGQTAISPMMDQIRNPHPIVREHILRALSLVANSNPILVEPCIAKLTDPFEQGTVRAAAATVLGSVGTEAHLAVPGLLRACDADQPTELRAAAILAIARIDPRQAAVVIQRNINDDQRLVRASASYSHHCCGDTGTCLEELLSQLCGSEDDQLVHGVIADIGPAASPYLLPIAASKQRSAIERLCCVQAAVAMPTVEWPALVRLLDDDDIGDQVARLIEPAENFESEVTPLLIGLLREGRVGTATRGRIVSMLEADGFGDAGEEDKWANTLAINQPGAGKSFESHPESRIASQLMPSAAMPSADMQAEFTPPLAKKSLPPSSEKQPEDRKVSVFYGTNRTPLAAIGSSTSITGVHVGLATMALAGMACCFFLFPKHSNLRYAIASLVGMGTVSTIALQLMLLTNWNGASREMLRYGGQYSDQVQYGVCEVSIPMGHQAGELEGPQMFKMEVTPDPEKHIVLTKVGRLDTASFHAALQTEMARKGKNIFVFIHGYNVSFEDAARRTGQMAYDLKFPGAPVFYSWPSQANWYSYVTDKENIDLSTSQIRAFLLDIASRSKADTINLIAHSMGNVGLTAALSEIEQTSKPHFNQVVLAAPDIDAEVFKDEIASKIVTKARHTTLYTSKSDLALIASRYFHHGNRVGDSGPDVLIIDGIDTIDATAVDSSLLGHSYYGSNVTVLDDLEQLFQNQPIESRHYLKSIVTATRPYWAFEPLRISRVSLPQLEQRR